MAKITIAGDAIVITSALKLEDIKTISKFRKDALTLKGGENGKEPIFAICATSGRGSIGSMGVSFGRETRDEDKLAMVTLLDHATDDCDLTEWIVDNLGGALMKLNQLEATLPAVLEEIAAEKAAIIENIAVAQ